MRNCSYLSNFTRIISFPWGCWVFLRQLGPTAKNFSPDSCSLSDQSERTSKRLQIMLRKWKLMISDHKVDGIQLFCHLFFCACTKSIKSSLYVGPVGRALPHFFCCMLHYHDGYAEKIWKRKTANDSTSDTAQRTSTKSLNSFNSIEEEFIWWNEISNFTSQLFPLRFFFCLSVEFHASCLPLAACEVSNLRSAAFRFQFYYFSPSSSLFSSPRCSPLASVIIYWVFHSRSVVFLEHFIHNTVSRSAGIWLLSDLFLPPRLCLFST